jgi:hypothetical protein
VTRREGVALVHVWARADHRMSPPELNLKLGRSGYKSAMTRQYLIELYYRLRKEPQDV